jgi:hypothetical protein
MPTHILRLIDAIEHLATAIMFTDLSQISPFPYRLFRSMKPSICPAPPEAVPVITPHAEFRNKMLDKRTIE